MSELDSEIQELSTKIGSGESRNEQLKTESLMSVLVESSEIENEASDNL